MARSFPVVAVSRFAEFKLYLANHAVAEAKPASQLARVAETAVRRILRYAPIASVMDWPAVLARYRSLQPGDFQPDPSMEIP